MAFKLFGKKQKPRACVVGLDGVPCTLLQDMMERGVMPNTRRISENAVLRDMTVSLPEISSVSWSTFMTGKNSGEHGIFGFTDLKDNSYDLRFPSFKDLQSETIWDVLGRHDMRSIVINQPSTYPAREVPGVLISGFVAIELAKALYPRKYLASLARVRYQIDIEASECRDNPDRLFADLKSTLDARRAIMDELWDKEDWNLMELVVTGTDRLYHFAFDAYEDESDPRHARFLEYHHQVDEFIGYVYDKFTSDGGGENFYMLSDHGFCQTRQEAYINTVLEQHGYLVREDDKSGLEAIGERTKAFALDPARIYVHRKGKYPRGAVEAGDVAQIKQELTAIFEAAETDHDGTREKFVRRVFDGDAVYSGAHADKGPDLLLIPKNGYDMKGRIGSPAVIGERKLQGMHTWDNAFFLSCRKDVLSADEEFTIVDVPWKILRSLDVSA